MSQPRLPPPEPEDCLIRSRVSRYKGGTLVAEDVVDPDVHRPRLADPDGYRPKECPRCGADVLHVHDYLTRIFRGRDNLRIVRYRCANPTCRATWRILPAFLARHLHRPWSTIERVVLEDQHTGNVVPNTTKRRWCSRLLSSARHLVALLAGNFGTWLEHIAKTAGLDSTRFELVETYGNFVKPPSGQSLSQIAALIHRLERGIRLM